MINAPFSKEEIEELYEIRSNFNDATDREKYLLIEAIFDLMVQFKRKNRV